MGEIKKIENLAHHFMPLTIEPFESLYKPAIFGNELPNPFHLGLIPTLVDIGVTVFQHRLECPSPETAISKPVFYL